MIYSNIGGKVIIHCAKLGENGKKGGVRPKSGGEMHLRLFRAVKNKPWTAEFPP